MNEILKKLNVSKRNLFKLNFNFYKKFEAIIFINHPILMTKLCSFFLVKIQTTDWILAHNSKPVDLIVTVLRKINSKWTRTNLHGKS